MNFHDLWIHRLSLRMRNPSSFFQRTYVILKVTTAALNDLGSKFSTYGVGVGLFQFDNANI